jgi:hypothetical protein
MTCVFKEQELKKKNSRLASNSARSIRMTMNTSQWYAVAVHHISHQLSVKDTGPKQESDHGDSDASA